MEVFGAGLFVIGSLMEGESRIGQKTLINGRVAEIIAIEANKQSLDFFSEIGVKAALYLSNVRKKTFRLAPK